MNKKKFTMPTSYTVLFFIIVAIAILTWLIPSGAYETTKAGNIIAGTYHQTASHPQGIWDVFMAPIRGMLGTETTPGAMEISFFIIVIGGFLGVITKTGALDAGISSVVKNNKGREKRLIPILMILFALGGTSFGMAEETMAFYPLLIPVMIAVGFDSIVAVGIVLIGSQIGCLASTTNPFATGVASQALGISPGDGIIWRILLLVVTLSAGIIYVYRYASKIEKNPEASLMYHQREADLEHFKINENMESITPKQKKVLTLFILTFVIMIFGLIPWSSINPKWTIFETFNTWLTNLPLLGALIGKDIAPFGTWYFTEITMLMFLMAVIIGIVYRMKEEDFVSTFISGAGELLGVALICAIARGIQVVMNDGMITATVLHWGEQGLSGLSSVVFIVLTFIFYIPMSFLIPSTSGLAAATMGIIGPMGNFAGVPEHLVVTAYQAGSGIVNLITPTSGVVMGGLALARVDLTIWLKFMVKLIVILFILTCIVLGIAAVM